MKSYSTLSSFWYNAIYDVMHSTGDEFGYDVHKCKMRQSAAGVTLYDRETYWIPRNGADEIDCEFLESLKCHGIYASMKKFGTGWVVDVDCFYGDAVEAACEHNASDDEPDVDEWLAIIQKGEA